MTETERRLQKLARYHLYLFILPALSLVFYGWLYAPELNQRPDNPQQTTALHQRGRILDGHGEPLAQTIDRQRSYPLKASTGPLIGYVLRGQNQTGLESILREQLSSPLPPKTLSEAIQLDADRSDDGGDQRGAPDVRLTLDSKLQKALFEALDPLPGAVVVADRSGRVLAAVSSPSFDPESVARRWNELHSDPDSPFVERVGGGLYPVLLPGGLPLVSKADSSDQPWFGADAFADYPTSTTSARWLDDRELVTPLMLLQVAYKLAGHQRVPVPTVLDRRVATLVHLGGTHLDLEHEIRDGLTLWRLEGPAFRDSPPFLPLVGHREGELYFAVILERIDESSEQLLTRELLPILQAYNTSAW